MKHLLTIFFLISHWCLGQDTHGLKADVLAIKAIKDRKPIEKLYLQLDKPYYTEGDTLRFKAYLLKGDFLTPSTLSGLLYVELDNMENQTIKRIMVPVALGLAWGDIALDEKVIPEGTYTLRAYTNWMRNFGEQCVFKQQVNVSSTTASTLIKTSFKLQSQANKPHIEATLQLTGLDGHVQPLQDMQLSIMDGKKNLSGAKVATDFDGVLKVNIDVPDKTTVNSLSMKIQQAGKDGELTIPVAVIRPENTDVQFMPEGGSMVAGIKTKIGFKAISEDGKGINISGKIKNSKQEEVAQLVSVHSGMGAFELTPQAEETYAAQIVLSNGTIKNYPLPAVNPTGTALKVIQKGNDSLAITLSATNTGQDNGIYYLIGQSRGVVCYAEALSFTANHIDKSIPQNLFPTGIARFTLLNQSYQPLNERMVFINHNDNLQISIHTNKLNYNIRDSIAFAIQIKDKEGKPVQGSFSLAVTDANQVKTDSTGNTIVTNLLLTSDLKGNIEEPGYYFTGNRTAELDNLMLTQGWTGYDWKEVFYPQSAQPEFPAENEFLVKGTVTSAFGKPLPKVDVVLLGNNPLIVKDTIADKDGRFVFKGLFPVDTALFRLQAKNKNGNAFNVQIKTAGPNFPVFSLPAAFTPWYVNSDSTLLNNAKTKAAELKAIANYKGEGHLLKEVNIKAKKIIPGSKNLNGPGIADEIFDEKDLYKAGKMTLGDYLEQNLKGFLIFGNWLYSPRAHPVPMTYVIENKKIDFVFDGVDLDFFYPGGNINDRLNFIKSYLDYFTTEDIVGIEVMHTLKTDAVYTTDLVDFRSKQPAEPDVNAFIEITTRSKQGPFMKVTPGTFLYKTIAFTLPTKFYRPRYTLKNRTTGLGTDLRSTIHWEPNIVTNKDGRAWVSFYSADKASTYSIIIEGISLEGDIGYYRQKIDVAATKIFDQ